MTTTAEAKQENQLSNAGVFLFYVVVVALLLFWMAAVVVWGARRRKAARRGRSVTVLVLGDVGRSPRMQYHALCLARHYADHVDLVGSVGTPPLAAVATAPHIALVLMQPFPQLPASLGPRAVRRLLFLAYAPVKVVAQTLRLLHALLWRARPPSHVLVQNPPSLPALFAAWLAARAAGAAFVVDWHNLGHTLLALSLGSQRHPLVRVAEQVERLFGARCGDAHLAVTAAMRDHLRGPWGAVPPSVPIAVLRDQPHGAFVPLAPAARAEFLARFLHPFTVDTQLTATQRSIVAAAAAGSDRDTAVVVSSTSWTPDEDFAVLLDALVEYDRRTAPSTQAKRLLVVITGKGPEREMYLRKIAALCMRRVAIITAWLANEDYPLALGAADIGVSLHQSSSQLDLPMKVLDMFGCGLPVLARRYPCLQQELVQEGVTGMTFGTSAELASQLQSLFATADGPAIFASLRSGVAARLAAQGTWETEWQKHGLPLFQHHCPM